MSETQRKRLRDVLKQKKRARLAHAARPNIPDEVADGMSKKDKKRMVKQMKSRGLEEIFNDFGIHDQQAKKEIVEAIQSGKCGTMQELGTLLAKLGGTMPHPDKLEEQVTERLGARTTPQHETTSSQSSVPPAAPKLTKNQRKRLARAAHKTADGVRPSIKRLSEKRAERTSESSQQQID